MIRKTFRYSFWNIFDNYFFLLAINGAWLVIHAVVILAYYQARSLEFFPAWLEPVKKIIFLQYNTGRLDNPELISIVSQTEIFMTFLIILLFSPFTAAVFCSNRNISHKSPLSLTSLISCFKKTFFMALLLLVINLIIVKGVFFNFYFYYRYFSSIPVLTFIYLAAFAVFLFFYLGLNIYLLPVVINEEKKFFSSIKRSYSLCISAILVSGSALLLLLLTALLPLLYRFTPLTVGVYLLIFPAYYGQFLAETYITVTEKFGGKRNHIEKRKVKDLLIKTKKKR